MNINKKRFFLFIILFILLFISGFVLITTKPIFNSTYLQLLGKKVKLSSSYQEDLVIKPNSLPRVEDYPSVWLLPNKYLYYPSLIEEFFQDGLDNKQVQNRNLFKAHRRIGGIVAFYQDLNLSDLDYQLKLYFRLIDQLIQQESDQKDTKEKFGNLNLIYQYLNKHYQDLETLYFYKHDQIKKIDQTKLKILFYDTFQTLKNKIRNQVIFFSNDQRVIFFEEVKKNREFGIYQIKLNKNFSNTNFFLNNNLITDKKISSSDYFVLDNLLINNESYLSFSQQPFLETNWLNFIKENNEFRYKLPLNNLEDNKYLISYQNFYPYQGQLQLVEILPLGSDSCDQSLLNNNLPLLDSKINISLNFFNNCFNILHQRSLASLLNDNQTVFSFTAKSDGRYFLRIFGPNIAYYHLPKIKIYQNLDQVIPLIKKVSPSSIEEWNNSNKIDDLVNSVVKQNQLNTILQTEVWSQNQITNFKNSLPFGYKVKIKNVPIDEVLLAQCQKNNSENSCLQNNQSMTIEIINLIYLFTLLVFIITVIFLLNFGLNYGFLKYYDYPFTSKWLNGLKYLFQLGIKILKIFFSFLSKILVLLAQKIRLFIFGLFIFLNYWLYNFGDMASDRLSLLFLATFVFLMIGFYLDERMAFILALFYLILTPFLLMFNNEKIAENSAILAYYGLVVGVLSSVVVLRNKTKNLTFGFKLFYLIKHDIVSHYYQYKKYLKFHPVVAKINIFIIEEILFYGLVAILFWMLLVNWKEQFLFSLQTTVNQPMIFFGQHFLGSSILIFIFLIFIFKRNNFFDFKSKILIYLIIILLFNFKYFSFLQQFYENKPIINKISYLKGDIWWEVSLIGTNFGEVFYSDNLLQLDKQDLRVLYWSDTRVVFSINKDIHHSGYVKLKNSHQKTSKKIYLQI